MKTSVARRRSMNRWSLSHWRRGFFCLTMALAATAAHADPGISFSAALAVSDNAAGSPQLVSLSGNGVTTYFNRSPSSINFGDQYVYMKSAAQTLTIRNDWNATLHISGAVVSGTNKADFAADTTHC